MPDSSEERNPVELLAEDFMARKRKGEKPTLSEYTSQHPELAEDIRELFPALLMMEDLGDSSLAATGPHQIQATATLTHLGDYRILREVGRGGMGVVYEAEQESLGRRVALKVLPPHMLNDSQQVRRFEGEARAAAKLHHTNIVPVFGVGSDQGMHYYVMQFIQGLGLDEVLQELKHLHKPKGEVQLRRTDRPDEPASPRSEIVKSLATGGFAPTLPQSHQRSSDSSVTRLPGGSALSTVSESDSRYCRSVARIGVQVAEALDYAHSQGILHRDIKPSNLLLDLRGTVWVTDFGLAKAASPGREPGEGDITHTGDIVGTIRYMAPERFSGQSDARADEYALGLTLYELLTLRPAFTERDRAKLMQQVLHDEPPELRKLNSVVPRDLETIIHKAISKESAQRYGSARELAQDLQRFIEDRPIRARRTSTRERVWRWCRRNPGLAVASALAALALVAVAGLSTGFAVYQTKTAEQLRGEQQQTKAALADANTQRALAEQAASRLDGEQQQTQAALQDARTQRDRAELVSTNLALDRALNLCEQGDVGVGLLWLARSLEIAPPQAGDLRGAIQANLSHWSRQVVPLRALLPHNDAVMAVAFSSDGKRLVSAGWDHTARIWNAATGELFCPPLQHPHSVETVVFNPDGRLIFTGNVGGTGRLWDAVTGKPVGAPLQHPAGKVCAAFSPDGKKVWTGTSDGNVRGWETATGTLLVTHLCHDRSISALALSRDGKTMLTGSLDGTARLWDVSDKVKPKGEPLLHAQPVWTVALSPDGQMVLTGGDGAQLWEAATGKTIGSPLPHSGHVSCVAFSPDGKTMLTSGSDKTVRLWVTADRKPLALPMQHRGPVHAAAFSPQGDTLVTGSTENAARVWDLTGLNGSPQIVTHGAWVRAVAISPDGSRLLTGSDDSSARLCATTADNTASVVLRHDHRVRSVAYSRDGEFVVTGSFDGTARLWNARNGQAIGTPFRHGNQVWAVAISPDGKTIATGGRDGKVWRWDRSSGKRVDVPLDADGGRIHALSFRPDGKLILSAHMDGTARLWDAATGKPVEPTLRHRDAVWAAAFSPDGRTILTGSWDQTARLWDAATGQPKGEPFQHQAKVEAAAFSPDGRSILTGSLDGTARLWDTATGKPVGPAFRHEDMVLAVAFAPDGKILATGCANRSARLWHLPTTIEGATEDILAWVQVLTGLRLDAAGVVTVLDVPSWHQCSHRLEHSPLMKTLQAAHAGLPPEKIARPLTPQEAVEHWTQQLRNKPQDVEAYYRRGEAHEKLGDHRKVIADYSMALDLLPAVDANRIELLNRRAGNYLALREYDKALADILDAEHQDAARGADIRHTQASFLVNRAQATEAKDPAASLLDLRHAAAIDPKHAMANNNLAWLLVTGPKELRNVKEALTHARAAVARDDQQMYVNTLGVALYRNELYSEAVPILEKSLAAGRGQTDGFDLFFLAMCHARLGDPTKARDCFDRAVKWVDGQKNLPATWAEELKSFRAEAEESLPSP
jgi:WD40 repeat protein/serine/threonine protein kinase/tetratricopeptide (TPR) repeat protein